MYVQTKAKLKNRYLIKLKFIFYYNLKFQKIYKFKQSTIILHEYKIKLKTRKM